MPHWRRGSVPEEEERYHRKVPEHELMALRRRARSCSATGSIAQFPNVSVSPRRPLPGVTVSRGWARAVIHLKGSPQSRALELRARGSKRQEPLPSPPLAHALYVMTNEGAPRYASSAAGSEGAGATVGASSSCPSMAKTCWPGRSIASGGEPRGGLICTPGFSRLERFDKLEREQGRDPVARGRRERRLLRPLRLQDDVLRVYSRSPCRRPCARSTSRSGAINSGKPSLHRSARTSPRGRDRARALEGRNARPLLARAQEVPGHELRATTRRCSYGYGGFNINLLPASAARATPSWSAAASTCQRAQRRGGGELGEGWHRGGSSSRTSRTRSTISSRSRKS